MIKGRAWAFACAWILLPLSAQGTGTRVLYRAEEKGNGDYTQFQILTTGDVPEEISRRCVRIYVFRKWQKN